MKALVCGGRDYRDRDHVFRTLDALHARHVISLVIHGACGWDADDERTFTRPIRGADGLADAWAQSRGVRVERVPAHWTTLGGVAGPRRNGVMVTMKPNMVVVFPGDRGTRNARSQAERAGLTIVDATDSTREVA